MEIINQFHFGVISLQVGSGALQLGEIHFPTPAFPTKPLPKSSEIFSPEVASPIVQSCTTFINQGRFYSYKGGLLTI